MKNKQMNKNAVIRNINGLSVGDRAYCGPYGTITCTEPSFCGLRNTRKFKVANSTKLHNGGNYTMQRLRKAISA